MTELIIYLIGVVFVFVIGVILIIDNGETDITLGKVSKLILFSILSWVTVGLFLIFLILDGLEGLFESDKVIYHRKKQECLSPNEIEDMKDLIERAKEKYGNSEMTLPEKYLILDDRGPMGSGGVAYLTKIRINDDKPEYYLDFWGEGWKSPDELIEQFSGIINEDKLKKILMSVCLEVDEFDSRLNQLLKDFSYLPQENVAECLSFYLDVIRKKIKERQI